MDNQNTATSTGQIPIRRIILFNSGLSQVVHVGQVEDNQTIDISFKSNEVDDALKSLVLHDSDGGNVRAVEYKTAPDSRDLAAQEIAQPLTLAQTLLTNRGESVTLRWKGQEISGSIVSVENRQHQNGFTETLLLHSESQFRSFPIDQIDSFQFDNKKKRQQFELGLHGLVDARLRNLKKLQVHFDGKGNRNVGFSYVLDSPIWRMTYRLDVKDNKAKLQGWAHVDNATDKNWDEINLTLCSGRPQTFHVDLFAPMLAKRPSVGISVFDLPSDLNLIAKWITGERFNDYFDSEFPLLDQDFRKPSNKVIRGGGFSGGGGGFGGGGGGFGGAGSGSSGGIFRGGESDGAGRDLDINSAISAVADVEQKSRIIQFDIEDKVSLKSGHSAMIPIIAATIPVKLATYFGIGAEDSEDQRGMQYAQLTNQSAQPIIPGPVAVYIDGVFVGDGALPRIEQDQPSGFAYGTDVAVSHVAKDPTYEITTIGVVRNKDEINVTSNHVTKQEFLFTNRDSKDRIFLFKLPFNDDTKITPAPTLVADGIASYEVACPANESAAIEIVQSKKSTREMEIDDIELADLASWKKDNTEIPANLLDSFEQILVLKTARVTNIERRRELQTKISDVFVEQERLIELLKSVESNSDLAKSFETKLAGEESLLDKLRDQIQQNRLEITEIEQKIIVLIEE